MPLTIILAIGSLLTTAYAQDKISASHLEAAKKAIKALHATDQFDEFLPATARELSVQFINKYPNYSDFITKTVDDEALKLAKKRAELEQSAAEVYTKYFTEDELNQIAAFYNGKIGKKLLEKGPETINDLITAFRKWSYSLSETLAKNVSEIVEAKVKSSEKKSAKAK